MFQFLKDLIASTLIVFSMVPVFLLVTAPQPAQAQIPGFGVSLCDVEAFISSIVDSVTGFVTDTILPAAAEMFAPVVEWGSELLGFGGGALGSLLEGDIAGAAGEVIGGLLSIEVPVYDDSITDQINDSQLASDVGTLVEKECVLDGIVWVLARILIESMTEDLVTWIQTGFEGAPQFVTDFNGFLFDVGDKAFGEIIRNTDFAFLCSAFDVDVRFALTANVFGQTSDRVSCRLTDIVTNIQDFYAGNFTEAGWEGWFEMNLDSTSNPYGAYLGLYGEAMYVMANKRYEKDRQVEDGEGLLCVKDENDNCITPGSHISAQFNNVMGAQTDQLITADEIDEVLGALFQFLVNEIFKDEEGLAGTNFNDRARDSRQRELVSGQVSRLQTRINALLRTPDDLLPEEEAELLALRSELQGISPSDSNARSQLSRIGQDIRAIEIAVRERRQTPEVPIPAGGPGTGGLPGLPGAPPVTPTGDQITNPNPGGGGGGGGGGAPSAPPPPPSPPVANGGGGGGNGGGGGGGGSQSVPPPPPPPPGP